MAKRRSQLQGLLGPLETDVMELVWQLGDTTVRDLRGDLDVRAQGDVKIEQRVSLADDRWPAQWERAALRFLRGAQRAS